MLDIDVFAVDWLAADRQYAGADRFEISVLGKTREGKSVHIRVPFTPYFFVALPLAWSEPRRKYWLVEASGKYHAIHKLTRFVERVPLLGFTNNTKKVYAQFAFNTLESFKKAKWAFQRDGFHTYDAGLDPLLRFFHIRDITPASWVRATQCTQVDLSDSGRCCIESVDEYITDFQNMHPSSCEDQPPLIIASWDIECVSENGGFPESSRPNDKIITVGTAYQRYGDQEPFHRSAITLDTCAPIQGVDVVSCATEADVLNEWLAELQRFDVDLLLGYNTFGFDYKYIDGRAATLIDDDTGDSLVRLQSFGKFKEGGGKPVEKKLASSAYGENNYFYHSSPGVVTIDLLQIFRKELKLDSYSLNAVSTKFLDGEHKIDLKPHEIFSKFGGDDNDRAAIAEYCVRDVELPLKLMRKMSTLENLMQMANAVCCPIEYLQTRGQQIRVFSQLMRKARALGFICPDIKRGTDAGPPEKYEGATVLDARKGAYFDPISALDFASLYPSIMRAHCMCPSTIVLDAGYANLPGIQYYSVETAATRVTFAQNVPCVVPLLLEELSQFRKQAKKDMAAAKDRGDEFLATVYNGKQLAYKVSMNSIYGFFGATRGMLPLVDLAAAVTATGRKMIMHSKALAEKLVPGTEVVYGDTDSILCKFKVSDDKRYDMAEHFRVAEYVAGEITKTFQHPVELEFEKVYFPYLLFSKKRYAGLMWTNPSSSDYIDVKGIQLVRRDNAPIVKDVSNQMLRVIMYDRSVERAIETARDIVHQVLSGAYPLEKFIVSKALRSGYKNPGSLPHVTVAQKLRERGNPPAMGERVPFVFIRDAKNSDALQAQRAEDPEYVRDHAESIELDVLYYVKNQLLSPIVTLLEVLVDNGVDPTALITEYPPIAEKLKLLEKTKSEDIREAKRVRTNAANKQREITSFFFKKDT